MPKFAYTFAIVGLIAAMLACNMPSQEGVNAAVTALAQTAAAATVQAALTQAAGGNSAPGGPIPPVAPSFTFTPVFTPTSTPVPTSCYPMITALTNANVRSGPSTDYDPPLGYLPAGGTAPLAGRNDANTWWYIEFAGGPGGHGWIAQSVTSASCLPAIVAVVAAPPLPPTHTPVPGGGGGPFAVVSVSYSVSSFNEGGYYVGCPIVTAHITTNGAGDVDYRWTRSDGASAPTQTLHFNAAGTKNVKEKWYLGSVWAGGAAEWLGIYVDDPNHQDFGHVNIDACTSP